MVITGLTRNQFVPKAHEGSNPSLCAKQKGHPMRCPFCLAQRALSSPARLAREGSHTPLVDRQARLSGVECEYLRLRRISLRIATPNAVYFLFGAGRVLVRRAKRGACIKTSTRPALTTFTQYNWILIFVDIFDFGICSKKG